jgi:excisionase family DNA binding protein
MSITTRQSARAPQHPEADPAGAPLLVAVPDAARLLGIGPTFAWELVRAGAIPSVKLGRRVLVPRAALEHLAGAQTPAAAHERAGTTPVPAPGSHHHEERRRS